MKRISSRATFYYKRVFPVLWFGFLAAFVAFTLYHGVAAADPWFLIVPCAMAVMGYVGFRRLLWDVADEVLDAGDYLLVTDRGREARIPLADIMNVSASSYANPPRVTLRLVNAGELGSEVVFWPRISFSLRPFAKNAIVEDLIVRAYHARTKPR